MGPCQETELSDTRSGLQRVMSTVNSTEGEMKGVVDVKRPTPTRRRQVSGNVEDLSV